MAGDWIKVEKITPDKPEIRMVARACRVTVADAFCAFFRLWVYFDQTTEDGFIPHFFAEDADEISRLPGAGKAFECADWLLFDKTGCTIKNWDRHNGESAKKRVMSNRRKSRWRDNSELNGTQRERS